MISEAMAAAGRTRLFRPATDLRDAAGTDYLTSMASRRAGVSKGADTVYGTSMPAHVALRAVAARVASAEIVVLAPPAGGGRRAMAAAQRAKSRLAATPATTFDSLSITSRQRLMDKILAQGELETVPDHPYVRLRYAGTAMMDAPDQQLTGWAASFLRSIWLQTTGASADIVTYARVGVGARAVRVPVLIAPVPARWITFEAGVPWFSYAGARKKLRVDQVSICRSPNPLNPYAEGVGDTEALGGEMDAYRGYGTVLGTMLDNKAQPAALIHMPGADEDVVKKHARQWYTALGGAARQLMTHFMGGPAGEKLNVHRMSDSAADLEVVDMVDRLARLGIIGHGVPPALVGFAEEGNRSLAYVQNRALREQTVVPMLEAIRAHEQAWWFEAHLGRPAVFAGDDRMWVDWRLQELIDEETRATLMRAAPYNFDMAQMQEAAGFRAQPGDKKRRWVPIRTRLVPADMDPGDPRAEPPQAAPAGTGREDDEEEKD